MRVIAVVLLMSLAGCITDRGAEVRLYTAADVDAINAVAVCKAQARNLLQVSRCEVRR